MESSVLIVQVNREVESGRLSERKHNVDKSFEGGDASKTITDLCELAKVYKNRRRILVSETVRRINRKAYISSMSYRSSNQPSTDEGFICETEK